MFSPEGTTHAGRATMKVRAYAVLWTCRRPCWSDLDSVCRPALFLSAASIPLLCLLRMKDPTAWSPRDLPHQVHVSVGSGWRRETAPTALAGTTGWGIAVNVLVKADLGRLVDTRQGNLRWVIQPRQEPWDFGVMGIIRMVKPWHEWMFILFQPEPPQAEYLGQVKKFIGDDSMRRRF